MSVAEVLTALADPTRRDLLELLSVRGEATATALAEDLTSLLEHLVEDG